MGHKLRYIEIGLAKQKLATSQSIAFSIIKINQLAAVSDHLTTQSRARNLKCHVHLPTTKYIHTMGGNILTRVQRRVLC